MSKKPETHYSGYVEVVQPSSKSRQMNVSNEMQNKERSSYKDQYGGFSSNVTQSYKASEYVADKHTGQMGYKQEAKYTRTDRYVDKEEGYTREYQTQTKFIESVYPNKSSSSSKRINYY